MKSQYRTAKQKKKRFYAKKITKKEFCSRAQFIYQVKPAESKRNWDSEQNTEECLASENVTSYFPSNLAAWL